MSILTQFIFRLSFGMALGMALTSPRQVTSGYYRVHLYVLLGLNVLATMVALGARGSFAWAPPLAAAILSYAGSVCWLYEKPNSGRALLVLVGMVTLLGAWSATDWHRATSPAAALLTGLDPLTSGLVLGLTIAAMFLGHWYLNTPTMAIGPLEKLVVFMGAAIGLRAVAEGAGLALRLAEFGIPGTEQLLFVSLRWLSGIFGAMALAVMTWKTLKIPNTQSATGILYVAVIATFLGELTSLLLTAQSEYPMQTGMGTQLINRVAWASPLAKRQLFRLAATINGGVYSPLRSFPAAYRRRIINLVGDLVEVTSGRGTP